MTDVDAIVVGAGPNGLAAANVLADQGWRVHVVEAQPEPGGAVRTAELTAPGFRNDLFSSFYPLAVVSPVLASMELERHGLVWSHAPAVVGHVRPDRPALVLHRDVDATAAALDADCAGTGARYRRLIEEWATVEHSFMHALLRPFPPVRPGLGLLRRAGVHGALDLARRSLLPLRRFAQEALPGSDAGLLLAGSAMHADLGPDMPASGLFGWLLTGIGQMHGFPVPRGGADELTRALVRRMRAQGATLQLDAPVSEIVIRRGRAAGVRLADGTEIGARRAVVADCEASHLYGRMMAPDALPDGFLERVARIERAHATFKIDWALAGPIPWSDPSVHGAGTIHLADDLDEMTMSTAQISCGLVPDRPFLVIGQMTTADPSRSPAGTEAAWAYTHVPQVVRGDAGGEGISGAWCEADVARFAARVEARIERHAPGFLDLIVGRHLRSPKGFEADDANLVGGDINGGTAQLHQQLVFRPVAGASRATTPVRGLYLASASAHPGGGVHGACGANAARAAIARQRLRLG